ncbi:MAG: hypothetical protein A3G31_10130 [Candidatus Schekmanbacteria bacterium RIFCSPLOWO2_12_FULL_38_15]|uniref:ABC transporter domain-containing protein n=1 Tax=Candidatus Schekmanbacteria bacterium RIFCSPLOWO2_12_FULL_38_15 TaxID=1817883 RepID=A0A1F7SMS2_9BACT|nr:MAG: hypothetical protein A3G31_10130 [Candidatus Schekmanbacteria bacterium RIFCSPLOWO2_12_FULL_38_15]
MIQVSNLTKTYGEQILFDGVSFSISPGERVGLVGRNGHGKTTLFRLILGEENADSGTISIPNRYIISHLSQHISFTEDTILEEGCLSLRPQEKGRDETYKVETILNGLGFSKKDFGRNPYELSGGYQIRLNLAKVLVSEPDMILLDEPTNYLDIVSVRWLTRFLLAWKGELIIITHDRLFMDSVTTHTMAIHRCKVKKIAGSTQKLYDQIATEKEVYEQTRTNIEKKRREDEQFINRFRAKASKARAVQSRIKQLEKKGKLEELSDVKNLDFKFKSIPFFGKRLMDVEDLLFSFDHVSPPLIEGLNFSVAKNDRIGVIGKNGKGKTTLLNLLAGELSPISGNIITHPKLKAAYFGQTNIDRLNPQKTVEEEMLDAHPGHDRRASRNICGLMMFDGDKALKKVSVLSGGEKSRVLLGKLLVSPANLLLLDEPTNHLDMQSIDSVLEAINKFDGAVIVVTHSELILNSLATKLIVFDKGKVSIFEGTYHDFLERIGWEDEASLITDSNSRNGKSQDKPLSKKDERRARAQIISERSKILGALKSRIAKTENTIISLEKEINQNSEAYLEACQAGKNELIKELSKTIHQSQKKIEELFTELEVLFEEREKKTKEFEERLGNYSELQNF